MENIGEIKELCSKMLVNWFLIEKENPNTASDYYQKGDIIHIGSDTVIKFIEWEE